MPDNAYFRELWEKAGKTVERLRTMERPNILTTEDVKEKYDTTVKKVRAGFAFVKDGCAGLLVRDYSVRDLIVIFVVAACLGAGFKFVAEETITIGFDDYTLASKKTFYDLNALQQKIIDEGGSLAVSTRGQGGSCSQ